ncbi:MAG: hypothetical protein GX350_03615 [Erysipelotrichaceae bacterium]|nr:hypothetical protein [Erysipelotrichaceae bacterium]
MKRTKLNLGIALLTVVSTTVLYSCPPDFLEQEGINRSYSTEYLKISGKITDDEEKKIAYLYEFTDLGKK